MKSGSQRPHLVPLTAQTLVSTGAMLGLAFLSAKGLVKWTDAPLWVCMVLATALTATVSGLLLNASLLRAKSGEGRFLHSALQFEVASFAGFLVLVFFDAYGVLEMNLEKVGTGMPTMIAEASAAKRQLADATVEFDLHSSEAETAMAEYSRLYDDGKSSNDALALDFRKQAESARKAQADSRAQIREAQALYNKTIAERDRLLANQSLITRVLAGTATGDTPWVWALLGLFCFAAEWAVGVWAVGVFQLWRYILAPDEDEDEEPEKEIVVKHEAPTRQQALEMLGLERGGFVLMPRKRRK